MGSRLPLSTIEVVWSVGFGNWARVPWIAFLDSHVTTTQRGIYGVFLFREDVSGVSTFNQGVTEATLVARVPEIKLGVAFRSKQPGEIGEARAGIGMLRPRVFSRIASARCN